MFAANEANCRIKKGVAEALTLKGRVFEHFVDITIHDLPFRFYVTDEKVIQSLYNTYPLNWFGKHKSKPFLVYWINNQDFGFTDEQWENNSSYECVLHKSKERTFAIQRDFLGVEEKDHAFLVCSYFIGDGFYNFLRWIAPKYFIQTHKFLLHSSCTIDFNKEAYFCFGPSGAGKTTIASLLPKHRVLGDDMNVLKIENGRCWAQAGALGQALANPEEYNHWYPVRGLFWLEKSEHIYIEKMKATDQLIKLSSSVANLFWPTLSYDETQKVFTGLQNILKSVELKTLFFSKDRNVWPIVWNESMNKKEEQVCLTSV